MCAIDFKNYVWQTSRYLKIRKGGPDKEKTNGCRGIRRGFSSPTDQLSTNTENPSQRPATWTFVSRFCWSCLLPFPEEGRVPPL